MSEDVKSTSQAVGVSKRQKKQNKTKHVNGETFRITVKQMSLLIQSLTLNKL